MHVIEPGDDVELAATRVGAVIQTGNDWGCAYEQPLEAALKALSPAAPTAWTPADYSPPVFWRGAGHGDGANAGLVHHDSVLVIVMLASAEDLSAAHPESFFDPDRPEPQHVRHISYPSELHPVQRYIDGLSSLRDEPRRLVVGMVVGLPDETDQGAYDERALESLSSDPRLAYGSEDRRPVCRPTGGPVVVAYPTRRLLETARGLSRRRAGIALGSICQDDLTTFYAALARRVEDAARATCP